MMSTASSSCPRQPELVRRIERAFGMSLGPVSCHIVDPHGMAKVMSSAGWSKNEATGVVGFQLGENVYVRNDAPWTVLHELVHRIGVNADRLNRWVAEGLTEAIARELKRDPAEHRATYPAETAWVQNKLLPKLGLTAVQLGQILAKSKEPPVALADLLVAKDPGLDRAKLIAELRPQRPDAPGIGSATCRSCKNPSPPNFARLGEDAEGGRTTGLGLALVACGAALLIPAAARRLGGAS